MWLPPQVSASALEFPLRSWLHFNELEFSTLMKIILFQVRKSIPAIIFLFANALVYNNFFFNLNPQDAFFFFFTVCLVTSWMTCSHCFAIISRASTVTALPLGFLLSRVLLSWSFILFSVFQAWWLSLLK